MLKKLLLLSVVIFAANFATAQTLEELKADQGTKAAALAALEGQVGALKGELGAIDTKIKNMSGWDIGALGVLGANFSQFNNWGAADQNSFSAVVGASGNGFANLQNEKFFWRNGLALQIAQTKLSANAIESKNSEFETTADALALNSLYGYKLNSKWAISALGEYRTTILNNFNNPGFLDIGAGATWTPIPNAIVVFHPLNYNFIMAENDVAYTSSLGCKIMADYSYTLPNGIAWKTNLSSFLSYEDPNNLSNWVWTNGLSANIWKGLGVGVDFGFAGNKQIAFDKALTTNPDLMIDGDYDNPTQSFWVLGLSYNL